MIGRRSFIKALGFVPAAAAAPAETLKLAMPALAGLGSEVAAVFPSEPPVGAAEQGAGQIGSTYDPDFVAKYLLVNGLPEFAREALRRERRVPSGLDPDLAANRSFSLAAKVAMQRDRDFERACEDTMRQQRTSIARRALGKIIGQELYW